jgi:arylformamidase
MPTVYRGFDRAALDAQYNIRGRVPEFPDILARWIHQSDAAATRQRITRDIAYGPDPKQALDVYHPQQASGRVPCLLFIHGGYWQALGKHECSFLAEPYTARGVAVAMLDYRLAPHASMTEIVEDCRAGVVRLLGDAERLGLNPGRLVVAGHSAGGHLAAMMLATDFSSLGVRAAPFCAGVGISGLYDLEPIQLCYLNDTLGMSAEEALRLSPIRHRPRARVPLVLTVGDVEAPEFHRQQAALAAAWNHEATISTIGDVGHHYAAMQALGDPSHPLFQATLRLLRGDGAI